MEDGFELRAMEGDTSGYCLCRFWMTVVYRCVAASLTQQWLQMHRGKVVGAFSKARAGLCSPLHGGCAVVVNLTLKPR